MLHELSNIIDKNEIKNRKIKLIFGNLSLTPAHICGVKSLLEASEIEIELIYTTSVHTQLATLGAGLAVSELIPNQEIQDIPTNEPEAIETLSENQYETEHALEQALDLELQESEFKDSEEDNSVKTLYIKQTLRSGQTVSFDGNVVIIGDCNPGSEIIAGGDITVWGILSGIAHAGANGDYQACIRALRINAIQLRIADFFARKPDKLEVEKIEKTNTFIPEEAKISDGEIIIYTLNG